MASSGSYARGDQPRSVPDGLKDSYEEAIARQRAHNAKQEEAWYRKHPGVAESFIPVWGSAREAVADAYDGDIVGAIANAGLAVSDLAPGAYALKAGAKGLGKTGSHTWNATRKWMSRNGRLQPGQHGHHGLIPHKGWGKIVPEIIRNHPVNITATRDVADHMRIHGSYKGLPQYGPVERYWRGSPDWAKRAHVWGPTGVATAVDSHNERTRQ